MVGFPPEVTQRLVSTPEQMAAAWVGGPPDERAIVIAPYDARWPELFAGQAEVIGRAVPGWIAIEHVGSTAVPGLAAKPIIDIDLIVPDSGDEAAYLPGLERAGFRLVLREPEWHQHRMLTHGEPAVNLHVFGVGAAEHLRHLIFRDWLRAHPRDRERYERAKRALATRTAATPGDYNLAKNPIIDEIYARAFAAVEGR